MESCRVDSRVIRHDAELGFGGFSLRTTCGRAEEGLVEDHRVLNGLSSARTEVHRHISWVLHLVLHNSGRHQVVDLSSFEAVQVAQVVHLTNRVVVVVVLPHQAIRTEIQGISRQAMLEHLAFGHLVEDALVFDHLSLQVLNRRIMSVLWSFPSPLLLLARLHHLSSLGKHATLGSISGKRGSSLSTGSCLLPLL